jgi:Fe-S-cluster-containing dehydrogenase component
MSVLARSRRSTDPDRHVSRAARPGFSLDLARCVGCGACVLGCRIENQLPAEVSWRRIIQVNRSRIGGGPTYHLSVACHHCENPPCVTACPSRALEKRPDGLVLLAANRCIGCRYCEMACPFGAPSFDPDAGVVTKCHLCHHRLEEGLTPACVAACPTGALGHALSPDESGEPEPGMPGVPPLVPTLVPASGTPGFGDPAGAGPGFWVAAPGGAIRSRWYSELSALLGRKKEEPHGSA